MRLLVLDHFFGHDIDALRGACAPDDEIVVLPYQQIREEALRFMPVDVSQGMKAYAAFEGTADHAAWLRHLDGILGYEIRRSRCDAVVVPSDSLFYVRGFPEVCHARGIPFLVVMKETTLTRNAFERLVRQIREAAPPVFDAMAVCSHRQRDFWILAGADPDAVHVLGQPRFDVYAAHRGQRPLRDGQPALLFLSYHLTAYVPAELRDDRAEPPWADLHRQSVEALLALAREGWKVVFKPHPQQDLDEAMRLLSTAPEVDVVVASGGSDVRDLIRAADVVVGFQSTALIEAAVADVPVVYTGWDPKEQAMRTNLIPYDAISPPITVVEEAGDLRQAIIAARGRRQTDAERNAVAAFAEEYVGVIDGRASERVLSFLRAEIAAFAPADVAPARRRSPVVGYRFRRLARALVLAARRWATKRAQIGGTSTWS